MHVRPREVPLVLTAEVLRDPARWNDGAVAAAWDDLCRRQGGLEVLFQSREWFAHLGRNGGGAGRRVIVVRDERSAIVALGAVDEQPTELGLDVGARSLGAFRFRTAQLLGGQPLAPPDRAVHDRFVTALRDEVRDDDGVAMSMLPRDGLFRRAVAEAAAADPRFFLYAPALPGSGETHSLTMPSTFDDYAALHFNSKQRGNLKRRLHLIEREVGPPRLRRFDAPADVLPFLADARAVSAASWQYASVGPHFDAPDGWEDKLGDLARRGLFRSYMLYATERPIAFILGYRHGDILYHVKTGYDRSLARLAPGIALLCLVLEELGASGRPQRVNFMFGDAGYKRLFANVHVRSDELLLLRRTAANRLRCAAHAAFRAVVGYARDRIRRRVPLRRASPPRLTPHPL